MNMARRIFSLLLLIVLICTGCTDTYHETIPYKKVDFTIYPNDPMDTNISPEG